MQPILSWRPPTVIVQPWYRHQKYRFSGGQTSLSLVSFSVYFRLPTAVNEDLDCRCCRSHKGAPYSMHSLCTCARKWSLHTYAPARLGERKRSEGDSRNQRKESNERKDITERNVIKRTITHQEKKSDRFGRELHVSSFGRRLLDGDDWLRMWQVITNTGLGCGTCREQSLAFSVSIFRYSDAMVFQYL